MNVKNLIESGQIELYVAEALTTDEKRLIDELAIDNPEIVNEIKEAEDLWNNFAQAYTRNPRPQLRKKIIDQVIKEGGKINYLSEEKNDIENDSENIKWWLTAVAIGLLIIVSGLNYMFYMKWNEAEDELFKLRNTISIENINASQERIRESTN